MSLFLFPARVRWANADGTLTPEAYRALQALMARVGGPIGDQGLDTFADAVTADMPTGFEVTLQQASTDPQPKLFVVTATTQAAIAGWQYVLTNVATTTLTLPANPGPGDEVWVTIANGLDTNVVARNGQPIMGLPEDMTIDRVYADVQLRYVNPTLGWRII